MSVIVIQFMPRTWSCHCMHNTVTYKRGRQIATQTPRSLDWQHKNRQRDGDIFWTLLDSMWVSSYKSSAWRGVDQHLRVAVNLWIIVILSLYHLTWCTMNHGFRSKWDRKLSQYDVSYNHKVFDWLVYYLIQRRRSRIFDADVYKKFVFEDDEASSTARYTTSRNVDMMCRQIHEKLVIGYTTRPATSSHLKINFGSVSSKFWI